MKLNLKTPFDPGKTETDKMVRNLTDCLMVLQKQLLCILDGWLDTTNIKELSADKISAGIIKAAIEMISPLITGGQINGGTITGGTIRTAATGKRLELTKNLLSIYNANNNLNGMNISENDATYGDLSFYVDGEKAFEIYNAGGGYSLLPQTGFPLQVGGRLAETEIKNANAQLNYSSYKELSAEPDVQIDELRMFYDGTDLKVKFPDGTVKTVTLT